MNKPLPYVVAALICERVIQEKDESITLVRIADRIQYSIEGQSLPTDIKPMIGIQGFVSLKSGPVTGVHEVKIFIENPVGQRREALTLPVNLPGNDLGANVIINISLGIEHDGLYWFDILFDGEPLTKIPLVVTPVQKTAASPDKKS